MTGANPSSNDKVVDKGLLECRIDRSGEGEQNKLTVGEIFKIECKADSFVLNPSKLKFVTKKPYEIVILKPEMQPDGRLLLQATSYQVGAFHQEDVTLTDGVAQVGVQGLEFQVASVIDQKNPPQQPYGPFGAFTLGLPPFYLWSVLGVVLLFALLFGVKLFRNWQRRRLIAGLKKHDSRMSPHSQLHLRFRQLERQRMLDEGTSVKIVTEIDDIFRLFIIRQFKIPTYDWSDRVIMNDFSRRYSFIGGDLIKEMSIILRETKKLRTQNVIQVKDIDQLSRRIKRWADEVVRHTSTPSRNREASL